MSVANSMDVQLNVVPFDSAQFDTRMGAGPRQLLANGLVERLELRGHRVTVEEIAPPDGAFRAEIATAFALNRRLSGTVAAARERGAFPITLSGNCNSALGSVSGLGAASTGVLWFDAHGEFNTPESTSSGFLDGMPLSILTGRCWTTLAASIPGFTPVADSHVIFIGARDIDPLEAAQLSASAIVHLPMDHTESELASAVQALSSRVAQLYVHVDLDVLDVSEGRANAWAGSPGLTIDGVLGSIELAAARIPLAGGAVASYDPAYDQTGSICRAGISVVETLAKLAHVAHASR